MGFISQSFEALLNRYLALDPESQHRLAALDGKLIKIELTPTPIVLNLSIQSGKIHLNNEVVDQPDVLIKGTPLSLLHMSMAKDRKQFFSDDVSIEGNLELGQQIIDLFDTLEIDWEEHLSKIMGDVSSHQLGRLARGVKDVMNRFQESLLQNVNEYVHEEALIFPPREALNDFFNDIDVLRMDADRLEARVKRLIQKHNGE